MTFTVCQSITVKINGAVTSLNPGDTIDLLPNKAEKLLKAGVISPRPYLDQNDSLVIPFNSDQKYHWWAGGQAIPDTLRELFEERAAIMQFDGGQSRLEAERLAALDVIRPCEAS